MLGGITGYNLLGLDEGGVVVFGFLSGIVGTILLRTLASEEVFDFVAVGFMVLVACCLAVVFFAWCYGVMFGGGTVLQWVFAVLFPLSFVAYIFVLANMKS